MDPISVSIVLTSPIWLLIAAGVAVLVYDALRKRPEEGDLVVMGMVGIGLGLLSLLVMGGPIAGMPDMKVFSGTMVIDYPGYLAQLVILTGTAALLLLSPAYLKDRAFDRAEYYALMLFAAAGMAALAISRELATIFVNLELVSISVYVLAGSEKKCPASSEAGFKYFILGSFASAFILMGIAFIFGASGSTFLDVIAAGKNQPGLMLVGMGMLLVGFGFKLTLAPFHMYAPDVYEGSPTPVAAVIATTSKVATFTVFYQIVHAAGAAGAPKGIWAAFYFVAMASMVVGNAGAIVQANIKRLLAYSSIGHSGYLLIPLVVLLKNPASAPACASAIAYYLMAYTAMTLLAMGVVTVLAPGGEDKIDAWRGLGRRSPLMGALMTVALVSLIGMPPTVGFIGKLQLFSLAVETGHNWLAVAGILTSVLSAYYYLRLCVAMYFQEPVGGLQGSGHPSGWGLPGRVALGAGVVAIFFFALFPWAYLFQM